LGQLLVLLFAVRLGWFPVQGMEDARADHQGFSRAVDILRHLVLPVTTLSVLHLALVTRLTRTGLREELTKDYARTAHAKGLSSARVTTRHALRNALLPVVTVVGNDIGTLFTGAVLTEIIFAWPGLGRLLYDATLNRDYPLLMGIFLLVGTSVIVTNIVTDVVYVFLDPRVKYT
jgi:peptide/nickel transport system permease protein